MSCFLTPDDKSALQSVGCTKVVARRDVHGREYLKIKYLASSYLKIMSVVALIFPGASVASNMPGSLSFRLNPGSYRHTRLPR